MTRLDWGAAGERFYEAGVDRGVLYVGASAGIPWIGLVSISESPTGGDAKPYYQDGIKYANRAAAEEFEATIEAYTYPDEFAICDGTSSLGNGLFAMHQKRKPFGLCYRTMVGNDLEGLDHGYKLHLVYNALAEPSSRDNSTLSDSLDPFNFSWKLSTLPTSLSGYRPTAHFVIDSRTTPDELLNQIEAILYGDDSNPARLPTVQELIFRFDSFTATGFDAGLLTEPYFASFDSGLLTATQTSTIDGGTP